MWVDQCRIDPGRNGRRHHVEEGFRLRDPRRRERLLGAVVLVTVLTLGMASDARSALTAGVLRSPGSSYVEALAQGARGPVTLEITRAGQPLGTASDPSDPVLNVTAQAGDVITVLVGGYQALQTTFDGLPTFDASLCGGATTFAGHHSPGSSVFGVSAFDPAYQMNYAPPGHIAHGMVTGVFGDTFAGTFDGPVQASWDAYVATGQFLAEDPIVGGVRWLSGYQRAVGACPASGADGGGSGGGTTTSSPSADTTPPAGRLRGRLLVGGLRALIAGRATTTVVVGEAGVTIAQGVYLDNGAKLPALIAARTPLTLLARARAVSRRSGSITLRLRPTKKARALRHRSRVRVAVVTTLRDRAGNARRLPVRRVTLRRR
jgi:hypothetical protein